VFFGGARVFQHNRDELESVLAPGGEAFEAIDDLVGSVGGGYDPQGQRSGVVGQKGGSPGAKRDVAGAQLFEGEEAEGACRLV